MSALKQFLNKSAIISGLVAASIVTLPLAASAQGHGNGRSVKQSNHIIINNNINNGGRGYNRGRQNQHYGYNDRQHRRIDRRNNRRAYNRGYSNGSHNGGHHNGSSLVTGLIGGAILYSALNSSRNYNTHVGVSYSSGYSNYGYPRHGYSNYGYAPSYYTPRTRVVYVERPTTVIREVPVYTQAPQRAPVNYQYQPQQPQQQVAQNETCLQSREYTTTIEIGGASVPAYGQACLQPDGSWKFGDPIAAPSF